MRTLLLALLALLGLTATVHARLGETEDAVITRYGKPKAKMHRAWGDEEMFSMNGFNITVTFLNGVSRGELYRITSGKITDDQVANLLSANGEGYSWEELPKTDIPKNIFAPIKQMWRRPNLSTAALTDTSFEFKSIFLIIAQQDTANQKPAAPSTRGF